MRVKVFGLLSLLGLLNLWAAKGSKGNPLILKEEDRVLQTLSSFREALNQRDIDGILSFFSKGYQDSLRGVFERFFKDVRPEENHPMFYFYNPRAMAHYDTASVALKFLINGKQVSKHKRMFLKFNDKILFKKENGYWRIIHIKNWLKLLSEGGNNDFKR